MFYKIHQVKAEADSIYAIPSCFSLYLVAEKTGHQKNRKCSLALLEHLMTVPMKIHISTDNYPLLREKQWSSEFDQYRRSLLYLIYLKNIHAPFFFFFWSNTLFFTLLKLVLHLFVFHNTPEIAAKFIQLMLDYLMTFPSRNPNPTI